MGAEDSIIEQAQALLLTYYQHLHAKGHEIATLRVSGILWSRIASLYPWNAAEWDANLNRLTRSKPYWIEPTEYKEGRFAQNLITPPELTQPGWNAITSLMGQLPLSAPAFASASESTHLRYKRIGGSAIKHVGRSKPKGMGDPYVYLEALVWMLHVLATSPNVHEALKDRRALSAASALLAEAKKIALILDRPQAEPVFP